jgi:hypothetical protein
LDDENGDDDDDCDDENGNDDDDCGSKEEFICHDIFEIV